MDSLYSGFVFDVEDDPEAFHEIRLFVQGQSYPMPCNPKRHMTRVHTNVPRSGDVGLPMGWEMDVFRWSVKTSLRWDEPLLNWAAESVIALRYNDKQISCRPLLDLIMAPLAPQDFVLLDGETNPNGPTTTLWIREALPYEATIVSNTTLLVKLQEYLVAHTANGKMLMWCYLDGRLRRGVM